jgi:DNA polymerase-3 subunit epsilon
VVSDSQFIGSVGAVVRGTSIEEFTDANEADQQLVLF